VCIGVTSALVRVPFNEAAMQGSAVTFECSTGVVINKLRWFNNMCMTRSHSYVDCRQYVIYSGFSVANSVAQRFSVSVVDNATHVTRDLNINSTQLTDAGVYLCIEQAIGVTSFSDSSSAQLIVLGNYIWLSIKL